MTDEGTGTMLARDGRDLTAAAERGELPTPAYRQAVVGQILAHLDARRSVLLTGPPGVGKTAVVHGVAVAMAQRGAGRIVEIPSLPAAPPLADASDRAARLAREAAGTGTVVYVPDLRRLGGPALEALRPFVFSGEVALLVEAGTALGGLVERAPPEMFRLVEVEPLSREQVETTLTRRARQLGVPLDVSARDALLDLCARFLPGHAAPGPALDLLERVVERMADGPGSLSVPALTVPVIEQEFATRTGLPLLIVSRDATRRPADIRTWFQERIVGQHAAIEAVLEMISLVKAGLGDPERPLGTLLFAGPPGVGKGALARALAAFLFGAHDRLVRVDLGRLQQFDSFEELLGDGEGGLSTALRDRPFQVVVFEGLERGHANAWNVLGPILERGRVRLRSGETLDLRTTVVIATTEVGAPPEGVNDDADLRAIRARDALDRWFRPERIDRFNQVVVFHPLGPEQARSVVRQELQRVLGREGIASRGLTVDVDDAAIDLVVERGYDTRLGAHALVPTLLRLVVLPLAMTILERKVEPGQVLKVTARDNHVRVRIVEAGEGGRPAVEAEPPARADGRRATLRDLSLGVARCRAEIESLARAVDETGLQGRRSHLLERRKDPEFWKNPTEAARALKELERVTLVLDRVARLRVRVAGLEDELRGAESQRRTQRLSDVLDQLDLNLAAAWRELVHMGADGHWDALVEVAPEGEDGAFARDLLTRTYFEWARAQRLEWHWLHEPVGPTEVVLFALRGRYAHGLVKLEAGVHRVRPGEARAPASTARVRVAAWTDKATQVVPTFQRALDAVGAFGGALRSRVECGGGLALQNDRTVEGNLELAVEVAGPWADAPPPSDEVVRRVDEGAPSVRDHLTGHTDTRPDALSPERFHALLLRRIDHLAAQWLGRDYADDPTEA